MRVEIEGVRHHKCDWCRRDFTQEQASHLTIQIGERSGYSMPSELRRDSFPGWRFVRILKVPYLDFCPPNTSKCMQEFFEYYVSFQASPQCVEY